MRVEDQPLTVLLVDDHAVVRAGYRRLLEASWPGIAVVEASTGEEALSVYAHARVDVVVMDLTLPGIGGLETIRRITRRARGARILVFSIHDEDVFVDGALAAGARGYISKASAAEVLIEAVAQVARGERYVGADLGAAGCAGAAADNPLSVLSPRELDIFRLLAEGQTVARIAELLCLSAKTVANYNTQIRTKLGVASAAELARLAIRHGLVPV